MTQVLILKEVEHSHLGTLREDRLYELGHTTALALVNQGMAKFTNPTPLEEPSPPKFGEPLAPSSAASRVAPALPLPIAKLSKLGARLKRKRSVK